MRNFQILDTVDLSEDNAILRLTCGDGGSSNPVLAVRAEGSYVSISASYGPIEIALRPRFQELARVLARLKPVAGLQTTRQVGTAQAFLALGLKPDRTLLLRPTIVADATGHLSFNLMLTGEACEKLFEWLPVEVPA